LPRSLLQAKPVIVEKLDPGFLQGLHAWAGQFMCVRHPNHFTVSCGTVNEAYIKESADTKADARAKMLIYLLEQKLISDTLIK
jgi:hypothetical protein